MNVIHNTDTCLNVKQILDHLSYQCWKYNIKCGMSFGGARRIFSDAFMYEIRYEKEAACPESAGK